MNKSRFQGYDPSDMNYIKDDGGFFHDDITTCKDCGGDMMDHPLRDEYQEVLCDECYAERLLKEDAK